jgi:RNA polymerase sigma-70 factor (ECF subfamily)
MPTGPSDSSPRETIEEPEGEDAALVRRTLAGDPGAFEVLVRRHHRDLFRTLRRITRNVEDAEDLTQEAFLRGYRALDRFDPARPFRPWLWTIGIRLAFQRLAKKERGNVSLDTAGVEEDEGRAGSGAWWTDTRALEELDGRLLRREIDEALEELDPQHRAILLLRVVEERSYEEIAGILDVPIGTVMSRLSRARARLKAKLMDWSPEEKNHG